MYLFVEEVLTMPAFDEAFAVFVNWQTMMFCLGIYIVTYFIRVAVEYAWKGAKNAPVWNELLLPLGPIGTGVLIALISRKFPWPMPIANTLLGKFFYGMICGVASGWVYARFRTWLKLAAEKNEVGIASKILGKKPVPASERPTEPPSAPPAALPEPLSSLPEPEPALSDRPTDPPPPYPANE